MSLLKKIGKVDLLKLQVGVERKRQVEDGFFDGRFYPRTEKSKKEYSRKRKYNNYEDDDTV